MVAEFYVVLVTAGSREDAEKIASTLVEERLAGCCNIVPRVRSVYRWKGKICRDEETLLLIKTRRGRLAKLRARVVELHSYEVPEIIALPIRDGHRPYLDWLGQETSP